MNGSNLPLTQAFMNLKEQTQMQQDQTDNQVRRYFLFCSREILVVFEKIFRNGKVKISMLVVFNLTK